MALEPDQTLLDDTDTGPAEAPCRPASLPSLAQRFNTETKFHGLSLSQLAVHSLWIVDYLRALGGSDMIEEDLDSLVRCADDLESAILMMFQLAGGTRMELHQRYDALKAATLAARAMTVDMPRRQ